MTIERVPESESVMEHPESVPAFEAAGLVGGPLFPIYHFNAVALSRLLPEGGCVLDIGCGPATFLTYLLRGRPDLRAIGIDLSDRMLESAKAAVCRAGFADRVTLRKADFETVDRSVTEPIDAIACISALHHCPNFRSLVDVLSSAERLRARNNSAVWLFDLVRPESEKLIELIPRAFEVRQRHPLAAAFRRDWIDSLKAGWTSAEFETALRQAQLNVNSREANFSQLHWTGQAVPDRERLWVDSLLNDEAIASTAAMAAGFGISVDAGDTAGKLININSTGSSVL
ncbi:MAG: class I SAM-dependent methyltransferase [Planctomycetaceae bacterium]|nr:class I SAM-dependent methyltransferase [Planctomycetaceae bacterium]